MQEDQMSNSSNDGQIGLPIGSTVGKYEIKERHAMGGQAIVYKGYDSLLDRNVAIKQISSHLAEDAKFLERFRWEARILARLGAQQSGIVTIHELIVEERGLFIVMEWLTGHSLETIIRDTNGPSEPKATLQILWRLVAALHDVHRAGIIHRDIKPANIIIEEGLKPKITDFGVAASLSAQTSMLLGTTKYMAPEMFEGKEIDPRADMYSLGMVTYELLVGRPKFNEVFADIVRDPHSEAMRWMKWHGDESLAAPMLHELIPSIPESLSNIVMRMLAKNRDDRFANMEMLGRAIKSTYSPKGGSLPHPGAKRRPRLAAMSSSQEPISTANPTPYELQTPPTAELPKKRLGTKAKITIASTAFIVLLSVIIGLVVHSNSKQAYRRQQAMEAYSVAEESYQAGSFAQAAVEFENVARSWPKTFDAPAKAGVMTKLAAARAAVASAQSADDWDTIASLAADAKRMALDLQANKRNLIEWSRRIIEETERFEVERTLERKFQLAMSQANNDYDEGRLLEAQNRLERELAGALPPDKSEQKNALWHEIELALLHKQIQEQIRLGDNAAAQQDFAGAQSAYERAVMLSPGNRLPRPTKPTQKARELEQGIRQLKENVRQKGPILASKQQYFEAVRIADQARETGNKQAELDALIQAAKISSSDELASRMSMLMSEMAFDQGQAALARGNAAEARKLFRQAIEHDSSNSRAVAQIALLDQADKRRNLVSEGDAAMLQGDFESALIKFIEAARIDGDPPMDDRISQCRFSLLLNEAQRLRKEGQYRQAIDLYEQAREVRPSESDHVLNLQSAAALEEEYATYIQRGDELFASKQYGNARKEYAKAITKTSSPEEANRKIALSIYQENLSRGKAAMEVKNWDSARAYLKTAKSKELEAGMAGGEIDDLIQQVESQLSAQSD